MAVGDIIVFCRFRLDVGKKLHDLSSDTFKLAYIKSAANGGFDPAANTADPRWGSGGAINFSTGEVATGSSYSAGGHTLTSTTWTQVSDIPTFRADIVTTAQDASGFNDARWAIIFNNTDSGKRCVCYIDLGSDKSIVSGSISEDFFGSTNDIFTS